MSRTIRVTQVVFDLDGGGLETLVADMIRRWHGTDIVSSVVTLRGQEGRVGAQIRPLTDQFHVPRQTSAALLFPRSVARAIRATRPDVVHMHSGAWFKSALAARLAGAPRLVFTEHGREHYDPWLMRRLDRLAARWTDVVVPVSTRLAGYLERVIGVDPRRIVPIANGVDTERFAPAPRDPADLTALGFPADALVLGSIGRLEYVKRYDRMIDALTKLPPAFGGRPLVLVIFGDGNDRPRLEQLVRDRGLESRVRLPGWSDPVRAHRVLDVFSLTSDSEGMSVSLLESMATARAPVVMNVGANAELLGEALGAQLVPAGGDAAYVAAVAATFGDPARYEEVTRRARERSGHYALARMLERYEQVYRGEAVT